MVFFLRGLEAGNWAYCFKFGFFGAFSTPKNNIYLFLEFFMFKFILLPNFRGKKANGFKETFNYALRFTKEKEENE